jgi:hypothetical protein
MLVESHVDAAVGRLRAADESWGESIEEAKPHCQKKPATRVTSVGTMV